MPRFKLIRAMSMVGMIAASFAAQAFMPAPGLWGIDNELNGQPGRGFQLEVQNETLLFTYYGYRADGSSAFYLASGPMTGDRFTGVMSEYKGGTVVGGAYKPGAENGSVGNVQIAFTSGQHGIITFPGEAPKAVSKFEFGYPATPDGLKGKYIVAAINGLKTASTYFRLNRVTGTSSANGSGMVSDTRGGVTWTCENMVRGPYQGAIYCLEIDPSVGNDFNFMFKMSGDRGTGIAYSAGSADLPFHVLRIETNSGRATGLNDATDTSLRQRAARESESGASVSFSAVGGTSNPGAMLLSFEERAALDEWANEVRSSTTGQP